ncbi:MAG: ABC transporter substrate-binding protein [Polynucleobacter sp.]|nr:ABC transporter substrate-binding protein [Polynucleobacter sp.]
MNLRSEKQELKIVTSSLDERRKFLLRPLAISLCAAFPGSSLLGIGYAQAQAKTNVVRLGYQFHLWGAPAVVAIKKGLFLSNGLTVEGKRFSSGVEARNGMIAGSIDIATVGMTPFVLGAAQGGLIAIAAVCYAGKTAGVMAKAGAGITKVADLRGKKIASQVGSTLDNVFKAKIAPEAKLGPKDYTIVNVPFADQVSAVAAGSVDAFLGLEPFCALAEYKKIAVQLTDYYNYDIIPNMLVVSSSFAEKYPELVVEFLKSWIMAASLFQNQPNEVVRVMLEVYKESGYDVPAEVVSRVLGRLIVNPEFIPEVKVSYLAEAESLKAAGRLNQIPNPDIVLNTSFLARARIKA